MRPWMLRIPLGLVVVLAALLAHGGTLRGGFHYDDEAVILQNRATLTEPGSVIRGLHDPSAFTGGGKQGGMYRPVSHASHVLDAATGGWEDERPRPFAWHLTNLLLHAACAAALFALLRRVLRTWLPGGPGPDGLPEAAARAAFLGALWFAVVPVHSEVVNYVTARSESLAALFFLLALHAHHAAGDEGRTAGSRAGLTALSVASALLSFGSKETGVLLPAVAAALEIWGRSGDATVGERIRRAALRAAPLAAALVGYLLLRRAVLGQATIDLAARAAMEGAGVDPMVGGGRTMVAHLLTQARVAVAYALLLIFPFDLAPDHGVRVAAGIDAPTAAALAAIALAAGLVVRAAARGCRGVPLAALWAAAAAAPSVLVPLNVLMNEHRLYLPSTGLALLVGLGGDRVLSGARRFGPQARTAAGTGVVLALAAFVLVDRSRSKDWADPSRLWPRAVATSPESWRNQMHLGAVCFRLAQSTWSERLASRGRSAPADVLEMQGTALLDEARERYGEAHRLYPRAFETRLNLGYFHLYRGTLLHPEVLHDEVPSDVSDFEEAARWFVLAEESSPGSFRAHDNFAKSRALAGRVDEAIVEYERMAAEDTDRTTHYAWPLARLYGRVGRTEDALRMLAKIDALSPEQGGTVALLRAEALTRAKRFVEAKAALEDARRRLGPDDPMPDVYMARLLAATAVPENLPALRELWTLVLSREYRPGPKDRAVVDALK